VRLVLLATIVTAAAGALAPAAAAHSIVLPFSSRPADLQLYTVIVPTETDAATRAEFRLIARNPVLVGDLAWRITQTYANGETVRWIGPPESEFPASVTRLSEDAVPVDVATGLNGGGEIPAPGETSGGGEAVAAADTSGDSSDSIARAGAGAAILLGLGALAGVLLGRRRPGEAS